MSRTNCPICGTKLVNSDVGEFCVIHGPVAELLDEIEAIPVASSDPIPVVAKFADKVKVDPVTGCHLWQRAVDGRGYGIVTVDGKRTRAHRFAFEDEVRSLRKGEVAEHRCSTPGCVRASADPTQTHLDARTQSENMRLWYLRGLRDGAGFTGFKKLCGKGHAYTPRNVIRSREVKRSGRIKYRIQCKRCMYRRQVLYQSRARRSGERNVGTKSNRTASSRRKAA